MQITSGNIPKNIKNITLGNRKVGEGEPAFIIAEIANAHEGNFDTAIRMIDALSGSGVDAIKFQLHIPEAEMLPSHPKFNTTKQRSFSIAQLAKLKDYTESKGFYFLCTPFSREAVDALDALGVEAFKVGSGEVSDPAFVEYVARKKKTIILSSGMSTLEEIAEAKNIAARHNAPCAVLHCVWENPVRYEHINLAVIPKLRELFQVPIGLSDHTPEIFSAIAAVPYGVAIIEKHYTLDRNQQGTSDHKVSLEPGEFKVLVDAVRKIEKACGSEKQIWKEEESVAEWARHAVVSVRDIAEGEIITAEAISTKRPLYDGIPANEMAQVIGKKANCAIPKDSLIKKEHI